MTPPGRRLRVMHVLNVLSLSGMEYGVIKLVNRLDRERFEPSICCLRFRREVTAPLVRSDVPVFELHRREGRDWKVVGRLARLFREQQVDVVHSHNWQTFLYAVLARSLARRPIVIHGEHGREAGAVPWKRKWVSRRLARRVAQVTTVSRDLADELVADWGVPRSRVTAVANGVELERFDTTNSKLEALRQELDLRRDDRIVLAVGRLRPVKDYPTLLRAFALLRERVPRARLLVLGADFDTGTGPGVVRQAEDLGVADAVRFLGIRREVPEFLTLADAYVNSSVYEGMSNTILEAMAAATPVVATAVGGNPELVRDGVTGHLVPASDPETMAMRLGELLSDPESAREMGRAGRAFVERHHTMQAMVRGYSELYEEHTWRERVLPARAVRAPGTGRAKSALSAAARWGGLNLLSRRFSGDRLNILTYHRVLPLPRALDTPFHAMVMPRDQFDEQMAHLAATCNVLTLGEAIRRLGEGELPPRAVAVTFDDGFADNYDYAWPVLAKHGLPATFFLVTGAIDREVTLWWEEVGEIVRRLGSADADEFGLDDLPAKAAELLRGARNGADPLPVGRALVDWMNELGPSERTEVLEALRRCDPSAAARAASLMMSWEQVAEMAKAGMQFGAHTVTHAFMDQLDEEQTSREIEGSVNTLRDHVGGEVASFSYPRGRFSATAAEILRGVGVRGAVTTVSGSNPVGTDPFKLKRLESGYYRARVGFDRAVFETELEGWFHDRRRD